jgi:hypothetical protein
LKVLDRTLYDKLKGGHASDDLYREVRENLGISGKTQEDALLIWRVLVGRHLDQNIYQRIQAYDIEAEQAIPQLCDCLDYFEIAAT